jgi:hypothetical protein
MVRVSWRVWSAAALGLAVVQAPAAAQVDGLDLSSFELPAGFFELSDLALSGPRPGVVVATAATTFMGNVANVLVSTFTPPGSGRGFLLAVKPTDWSLTRMLPALSNPILDELTFQYVGLVVSNQALRLPASALSPEEREFYRDIYQRDDFTLTVTPGINLIAAIPAEGLPAGHPMVAVMDALGIEKGVILLQGTLGKSLTLLTNPAAGGADLIRDLYLRAELPPMRPAGSPAWFRSGQLALELTGDPSVRLVGEIGVTIDDDLLDFFLAATLARTGVSLSGGLRAEGGWDAPFGIEWLVIHELLFKLGITPTGSIEPGFAGRMVIGEKDIDVAVSLAISPAGVPTNFMFAGESEAGFGLSDLIQLQQAMRAARDAAAAATGGPAAPTEARIPLDALPDVSFKEVALKFAPKPSPELGVERGFAIKGELWVGSPGGRPSNVAGVDVNVGEDGLWARGHLAAYALGPLSWEDVELDLTMTPDDQHLKLTGQVQLFSSRQLVDLEMNRQSLRFHTETELFDLFHATLDAQAAFSLQNPAFQIHGVAHNDFGQLLSPIVREAAIRFVDGGQALVAQADAVLTGLGSALTVADATVEQLRAALVQTRATAEAAWQQAAQAAAQAGAAAREALNNRNAAYVAWRDTPARQVVVKAQRYAAWQSWAATHAVRAGVYAARAAAAEGARRIYVAIPTPDASIAVQQAAQAVARLRSQVEQAQASVRNLRDQLAALDQALAQGEVPFAIERAEVHADLAAMQRGEAVRWVIAGTFLDRPFTVDRSLSFQDVNGAVGEMFRGLVGW